MTRIVMSLLSALFLAAGCATNQNLTPEQQEAQTLRRAAAIARLAAYDASYLYLRSHPEHRLAFVAAHAQLDDMVKNSDGTLTLEDFLGIMQKLPIEQLKGPNGSLIVGNALIVFDELLNSSIQIDSAKLLPIAKAVRDGLAQGLGI